MDKENVMARWMFAPGRKGPTGGSGILSPRDGDWGTSLTPPIPIGSIPLWSIAPACPSNKLTSFKVELSY